MNKLRLFLLAIVPFLAGLLLGGCGQAGHGHYQVVPKEATGVVAINIDALKNKSGLGELLKPIVSEMAKEDQAMKKILDILANSHESGLALDHPLLAFFLVPGEQSGIAAKVVREKKLKELFDVLEEEGIFPAATQEGKYWQVTDNSNYLIMFNKDKLVGLTYKDNQTTPTYARKLLEQKEEESIVSNMDFMKNLNKEDDLSVYFSYAPLADLGMIPDIGFDFSKISILAGLGFKNGLISMDTHIFTSDEETGKQMQQYLSYIRKITRSQLDFFPATTLALTVSNINGPLYLQLMEKYLDVIFNSYSQFLAMTGNDEFEMEEVMSVLKSVCGAIDGELTLGITGVSMMGIPSLLLHAEVINEEPVEMLNRYLPAIQYVSNVEEVSPGNYRCDFMIPGINLYYGNKEKLFYLTNDPVLAGNVGVKADQPFTGTVLAKMMPSTCRGYFIADLESILKLPIVSMLLNQQIAGQPQLQQFLSRLKYLEFVSEDGFSGKVNIHFNNKEQNALKTIVDAVNVQALIK